MRAAFETARETFDCATTALLRATSVSERIFGTCVLGLASLDPYVDGAR